MYGIDKKTNQSIFVEAIRLKLMTKVLAFRFGLSTTSLPGFASSMIIELDWMPSFEQVAGTLPCVFKRKVP